MKIYMQDNHWEGCIVVVANSKEEAYEMMKKEYNFDSNSKPEDLDEYEICHGLVLACWGAI